MKPTLLIAEADPELCELYARFFIRQEFTVETAQDGLNCLFKLEEFQPDLLILGFELLWGGGEGVLGCMHLDKRLRVVPVILLTTSFFPKLPDEGASLVVRTFSKPCRLNALLESINALLEVDNPCTRPASGATQQGGGQWLIS